MAGKVPVTEGAFTWPSDSPRLIGSRCVNCNNHMFPSQEGCPRCTGTETEKVELGTRGTLWTWTVQGFPPKAPPYIGDDNPLTFKPFGVGYVELPGQCKVEARLTEADPAKLKIGMEMELVFIPLATDDQGNEVITFAFKPAEN